jgi:hypothetical protein
MKSTIFWDITPCSLLKVNRRFGGTYRIHLKGRISRGRYHRESGWQAKTLVSCSAYSALKVEAIYSSETLDEFQWLTECYIPEDSTLHSSVVVNKSEDFIVS